MLPAALLAWRYPSAALALLERLTFLPSALPGIAVALALVFFGARFGSPVYQSLALLLFAYVIRFLPQALASSARRSTRQPALRGGGAIARPQAARRDARPRDLPLARSGVLAGAALVFLTTIKELPATLLLDPIGFETLATEIWKPHRGRRLLAGRAVPRSLLIVVSAPLLYLVTSDSRFEPRSSG